MTIGCYTSLDILAITFQSGNVHQATIMMDSPITETAGFGHKGWATILILWHVYMLFPYKRYPFDNKKKDQHEICVCFLNVCLTWICPEI